MPESPRVPRPRQRPALLIFIAVAVVVCLLLAWWQWSRYESSSGTFQNLGYALQWPVFAGFFVYVYRRFIHMEAEKEAEEAASDGDTTAGAQTAATDAAPGAMTEIPAEFLPNYRPADSRGAAPDRSTAYNAYLADLAEDDTEDT